MQDSIFTKIIKGEIPCHKIYEDDTTIVFLDIHPKTVGHTLVVPKRQVDLLWDLPEDEYYHAWEVAKQIEQKLRKTLSPLRVGAIVEGTDMPNHSHIHLVPLYAPKDMNNPQDMDAEPDHAKLAEVAAKLAI